jgi:steroid delta-isomerase-like uncharacterized protein
MSTEENKAKVRRVIEEVFNKGDVATVDEVIAANYVYHLPGGQELNGPEGLKQFVTMVRTAFPDFHITIDDMLAEGDKVACRYTWGGTHKGDFMGIAPTGKQVTAMGIIISHFAGGEEVELWESNDTLGMLQQMDLVPLMGQG